ncbi:hypothetical protein ACFL0M_08690 [Thermodesulfobacteriota bacterium]
MQAKGCGFIIILLAGILALSGAVASAASKPQTVAELALLFIDFEMTKKGAEILKAAGYSTFHKDVPVLKAYKKWFGPKDLQGVKRQQERFSKLFLKK